MTFPNITVKATNLELTPGLSSLIDQKLVPLGKLITPDAPDGYCRVELEKINPHQSGKIYHIEVNLFAHGKMYRTEATEEQVEKAVDEARDELKRELEKMQGKRQSLFRRGARMIKRMVRFE